MLKVNKLGYKIILGIVLVILATIVVYFVFPQLRITPKSAIALSESQRGPSTTSIASSGLIAFVSELSGNPEIYTMHADGTNVVELTKSSTKNYSPTWSSDGKRIAYIEDNGNANIFIMNSDGSAQTQLTDVKNKTVSFTWSPDGKKIEISEGKTGDSTSTSIYIREIGGNNSLKPIDESGYNLFKGWLPTSQQIIYEKENSISGMNTIYLASTDGSDKKELAQLTGSISILGWQDANHFYAVSNSGDLWDLYRFDLENTQPEKIAPSGNDGIVTWFANSNQQTYVTNHFESWTWHKIEGTSTETLLTWANYAAKCQKYLGIPELGGASSTTSPDGIYGFVSVGCEEGQTIFYLVNNEGSVITQLFGSPLPLQLVEASWSPDSKFVLADMGNNQTGRSDLYIINIEDALRDSSIQPVKLTSDNAWKYEALWQPKQ
jgi:WD40-like Beta Propeller Repeat